MITPNGRRKVTVYMRPDHYLWLKVLALDMVVTQGGGRPDMSRLLEGMIDFYRERSGERAKKLSGKRG